MTAIVTGATMGIGEAVTRRFVREGANVVLIARGAERGEELARQLGGCTRFVAGDVADGDTATRALSAARELGGVDVLVNNAAVDHVRPLLEVDTADASAVFATNFHGSLSMLVSVARDMREREAGGAIVNVTSRLASIGISGFAVYSAAKGALLSLTRTAAVELAEYGIRVNAVAPGLTSTPLVDAWIAAQPEPETFARDVARGIPQGRIATPEEVAATVAFLAAPESAHITGASIAVDGGYTAA
ncbi:MAG TPA: SDR family oxidoreductase [Solirubrobacteraceae bacterium]|jgi:NAD(P)-dependent dehydrogenase (short-subunit alcohol dehydrogenase family)|nr:SDR family oxidoreductase [Solirubrobacteraceae bacterium]